MRVAVVVLAVTALALPALTFGYLVWVGRATDRDARRRAAPDRPFAFVGDGITITPLGEDQRALPPA